MNKKLLMLIFGMFFLVLTVGFTSAITWNNTAYYKLDETSGDVIDSTGNGNNGTNNGATRGVKGKINNAFDFDGTDDYVDLSLTRTSSQMNSAFTFAGWFKTTNSDGTQNVIIGGRDTGSGENFRIFQQGGIIETNLYSGSSHTATSNENVNNGNWHQVIGISDGSGNYDLYLDGSLVAETSGYSYSADIPFYIGQRGDGRFYEGKIDELGIWDRALNSSEISELYNSGDALAFKSIDKVEVNLEKPENDTLTSDIGLNFTVSGNNLSEQGYEWKNLTYRLWDTDGVFNTTTKTLNNETLNETKFIDSFKLGRYYWNAKGCYGNTTYTNCTSYTDQNNYTFFVGASVSNKEYNDISYETKSESFKANISLLPGVNVYSTKLIYNGTKYNANFKSFNSQGYSLTKEIDLPLVNGSSKDYDWFYRIVYELSDGSFVTQDIAENTQTVKPINMSECGGSLTNQTINFTTYDEENMTRLKPFDFYGTFNFWLGSGDVRKEVSINNENVSETTLCIDPANQTYKSYSQIQYEKDGYIKRSHYLLERKLTSESQDEKLYFLKTDSSTSFTITIYDKNQIALPGVYLDMKRYYPGTDQTNTIEMAKTDTSGSSVGHFEAETENYKILVKEKDGTVLFESNTFKPFCEGADCSVEFSLQDEVKGVWKDIGNVTDLTSKFSFNESTEKLSYLYVDDSDNFTESRLYVYNKNPGTGKETVCNKTSTSTSDTMVCDVSGYNQIVAEAYLTRDKGEYYVGNYVVDVSGIDFGKEGLFLSIFILMLIAFIGIWNPSVAVILEMIGVILIDFIGLASFGPITKFGVIIGGLILLWVLKT